MGYRCTFITDDMNPEWSESFRNKWSELGVSFDGPLHSKSESKGWYVLVDDIQKELLRLGTSRDGGFNFPVYFVRVWEEGRVDRITINHDTIIMDTLEGKD